MFRGHHMLNHAFLNLGSKKKKKRREACTSGSLGSRLKRVMYLDVPTVLCHPVLLAQLYDTYR